MYLSSCVSVPATMTLGTLAAMWVYLCMYVYVYACVSLAKQLFCEYSLFNRALLQKRPIVLRQRVCHVVCLCMCVYLSMRMRIPLFYYDSCYGIPTISKLLKIISLFCKRARDYVLQKRAMILRSLLIVDTPYPCCELLSIYWHISVFACISLCVFVSPYTYYKSWYYLYDLVSISFKTIP